MTTKSKPGEWGWWVGENVETFNGPFATRDAAIAAGVQCDWGFDRKAMTCTFHICEAIQRPLNVADILDIDEAIERAEDGGIWSEAMGEDGDSLVEHVTVEQWADLKLRLHAVACEWHEANGVVILPFNFTDQRSEERVTVPARKSDEFAAMIASAGATA